MRSIRTTSLAGALLLATLAVASPAAHAQFYPGIYSDGFTGYSYGGYGAYGGYGGYGGYGAYGGYEPQVSGNVAASVVGATPYSQLDGGYYGGGSQLYNQPLPYGPLPSQPFFTTSRVGGVVNDIPRLNAALPGLSARVPALQAGVPMLPTGLPTLGNDIPTLSADLPVLPTALPALGAGVPALSTKLPSINGR